MHLRLLAVGDRQPSWVDDAVGSYTERYPREWRFRIDALPAARRGRNDPAEKALETEAAQLLQRFGAGERIVLLDERGRQLSSRELALRLAEWQSDGRDLCFVIGGPDGVADAVRERADFAWSLSSLTLPHGLARVLTAEQLYRAWSLRAGHPYHRD
jgi:23S rRNA (pseudouridine1915-N3)-methyltransferase